MWKAIVIVLPLAGCITLEQQQAIEQNYLLRFYSRADVDAINAQIVCKNAARNLVQVARCEVRR
jgi:hypothetical protein